MQTHRPKDLTTVATLMVIFNLILMVPTPLFALTANPAIRSATTPAPIMAVVFALAVSGLLAAWGLWTLKRWAYRLARIVAMLGIAMGLVGTVAAPLTGVFDPGPWLSLIFNGVIFYYLRRSSIRRAFL